MGTIENEDRAKINVWFKDVYIAGWMKGKNKKPDIKLSKPMLYYIISTTRRFEHSQKMCRGLFVTLRTMKHRL